jgi:hypothetical protein
MQLFEKNSSFAMARGLQLLGCAYLRLHAFCLQAALIKKKIVY